MVVVGLASELVIIFTAISLAPNSGWPTPLAVLCWGILLVGVLIPRRLRDIGWSVWLAALIFIPFVNFGLLILLLSKPGKEVRAGLFDPAQG